MLTKPKNLDTKGLSTSTAPVDMLIKRRIFLRGKEQLILTEIRDAKTDFERGRAFGAHEIIENELFFLDTLLSENAVQEMNDLNVNSDLNKIVIENDKHIEAVRQLHLNLNNQQKT